jgi:hypothetical protein
VICDEIDLCDVSFIATPSDLDTGRAGMVIGSKLIGGARTSARFSGTPPAWFTGLLRALLGFRGTDTRAQSFPASAAWFAPVGSTRTSSRAARDRAARASA